MAISLDPVATCVAQGTHVPSPNNKYQLHVQADGNIVLYKIGPWPRFTKQSIWSSGTYNRSGARAPYKLCIHSKGKLVLYDGNNKDIWSANGASLGTPPHRVLVQNDGNCVLYDSRNTAIWATNTRGK